MIIAGLKVGRRVGSEKNRERYHFLGDGRYIVSFLDFDNRAFPLATPAGGCRLLLCHHLI